MLKEAADLGFEYVELSHGTRITLVPGLLKGLEEGIVKVSSTHNFCPLPTGINHSAPNLFEPSGRSRQEHDQWLRHTKRSIEFSAQVGAKVMVTHLGSVHFFWTNPARKLRQYVKAHPDTNLKEDPVYQRLMEKSCRKLRARMTPYWDQVFASLEEIRTLAVEKAVSIGCENREKFQELPLDDDFGAMFARFTEPHTCGYWHDTGHAKLKEQMGLLNHRQHLRENASRLLGFHLHDVAEGDDHQPVGYGEIDFEMVSEFWEPHHLLTLELSPRVTPQHVKESKQRIEKLIAKRFG